MKYLQIEKLQEKFLPTYENELQQLTGYLARVEEALAAQDFSKMTPEFLLQTSLQIRTRLNKMREQMPLRTTADDEPFEPLPFTGCVSNGNVVATMREDFQTDLQAAAAKPVEPPPPSANPASAEAIPRSGIQNPTSGNHANGNGKPHHNGSPTSSDLTSERFND